MQRLLSASLVLLSLLSTLAGCSSDNASTGAATRDDFIAQFCAELSPCCAKAGLRSDGVTCRALLGAFAVGAYDPAAGNACLSEVRASSSQPTFCQTSKGGTSGPSCTKVFSGSSGGTVAPGGLCKKDGECAASTEGEVRCASRYSGGVETRKCQVQIPGGKAGDAPCVGTLDGSVTVYSYGAGTADLIPRGYLCDMSLGARCDAATGACVALSASGGACKTTSECVRDAYCDSKTSKCVARLPAGSPCTTFGEQCAKGTYCDSTSKCAPETPDGAPCGPSAHCASGVCVNGVCGGSGSGDLGLALFCGKP